MTHTPHSSRVLAAVSAFVPNFCLGLVALGILLCVAPQTPFSLPFVALYDLGRAALGWGQNSATQSVDQLAYIFGYTLLVGCLLAYAVARKQNVVAAKSAGFADVVALFATLLLFDPYVSVARDFSFQNRWWVFYAFTAFFVVLLCADEKRAWRLTQFVLVCIGVQALYAVAFYALHIDQFQGARFGARTGGTFGTPNPLYPLCLLAIPLALTLSCAPSSPEWRWTLRAIAIVSTAALLLTFTRGAWLALVVLALFFVFSRQSPLAGRPIWRAVAVAGVALLVLGVLLVRTRGTMMGGYADSSFWGRIEIWKVAARAVADKPALGSGINTYAMQQRRLMTPDLEEFRPANIEAKSLWLNVAVESGLLGLGLLLWGAWQFFKCYSAREKTLNPRTQAWRTGLFAALLSLGVAGCIDTPIFNSDRVAPTVALAVLLAALGVAMESASLARPSEEREVPTPEAPVKPQIVAGFVDAAHATRVLQAALSELDVLLRARNIEYWIIGSCARLAMMNRPARKVSDIDLIVLDAHALKSLDPELRALGQRYGLFVDASLSRVFRRAGSDYALGYGPLSYPLDSRVMETRRIEWGEARFSTLPPQTLLHTFGIVAEPLRPQDRGSAREFARFLKSHHKFDGQLLKPFHLFWRAHWHYFPLKPVQYWWRQRIKALPSGIRFWLLRQIYPLAPIRGLRSALTWLETRVCIAPRDAPERRTFSTQSRTTISKQVSPEMDTSLTRRISRGFTLVEMVIVLAVLGVLGALLFPAFSKSRQRSAQTTCAATLRQFGLAFTMYAQDFDGRLPNPGGRGMQAGNGNPAVMGGENGAVWCAYGGGKGLFAYLERQTDASNNHWSCPNALPYAPSWEDTQYNVGQSYSMNDYLRAANPGQSVTAEGDVPGQLNPIFQTGIKLDEIAASQVILLFEGVEHPRGGAKRNGSPYFGVYPSRYGVGDLPRNVPEEYHFGMSNFLFCDGHVKALQPTQTWTSATQVRVEKLNYGYAHARGGRAGSAAVDMWNPQTSSVVYP
ncbi:O-antigen ligase family protein [Abditibacterium utsteinense]|uniref:O-antigen ligase family protein n=1 Tax=Abditibacterium utsteinense TaxID=1960156 RepID=UPI00147522F6|nr:O-antigen ligase family protein [Abditibacterium utsteinense]